MSAHNQCLRLACGVVAIVVACLDPVHAAAPLDRKASPLCLAPGAWYRLSGETRRVTAAAEIYAEMAKRDVVLLGEQHDDADHHRWQLHSIAALHALRPQLAIGFEAFPRRAQPVLDRWVAGELTVGQFLEESEWNKVWNFPADLYLPMLHFARLHRIALIALNVERTLTRTVAERGWNAVPAAQREGVSEPARASEAYIEELFTAYREHLSGQHQRDRLTRGDAAFRYFVEAQTTWDRAMAEALARPITSAKAGDQPLVVAVVGAGHVRNGHGIAHQLRELGVDRIGSLLPVAAGDCSDLRRGLADAVFAVAPMPRDPAPPPRLGVTLADTAKRVTITQVAAGSLAEASGLQSGDRILEIAGRAVSASAAVVSAVRAQPAGTWLPIRIERGDEALDIIVRFPVKN